jgi:hypothetical protein
VLLLLLLNSEIQEHTSSWQGHQQNCSPNADDSSLAQESPLFGTSMAFSDQHP